MFEFFSGENDKSPAKYACKDFIVFHAQNLKKVNF